VSAFGIWATGAGTAREATTVTGYGGGGCSFLFRA
jgi:hypothetical protein